MPARTDRRSVCAVCGAKYWGYEGVHYGSEGDHCLPCFNRKAARQMGVAFDQADLQPVTVKDADGQPHTFHVQSRLAPTGHVVEAFEVEDRRPRGYRFAVLGDFEADAVSLFALVYEKIRTALARKQVRRSEFGWQLESTGRSPAGSGTTPRATCAFPSSRSTAGSSAGSSSATCS